MHSDSLENSRCELSLGVKDLSVDHIRNTPPCQENLKKQGGVFGQFFIFPDWRLPKTKIGACGGLVPGLDFVFALWKAFEIPVEVGRI